MERPAGGPGAARRSRKRCERFLLLPHEGVRVEVVMAEKKGKAASEPDYVVIESGKTTLRDLYTKEDWMAIWMGFLVILIGLIIFLPRPPEKMKESIAEYNQIMKAEAEK